MKYLFILLLLVVTGELHSQNYLYNIGTSGFHIAGQLGASSGSTFLSIRPGYTFNGLVTVGTVVGSEHLSALDINSTVIRPYLDFIVLKQDHNYAPVSLNLGVHYQNNSFQKLTNLSISTFGFTANLLRTIEVGNSTLIVPSLGVTWDKSTLNLLGIKASENFIGIGLSTAFKFNHLYVEPLVSFRKGGAQFGISIGFLFTK